MEVYLSQFCQKGDTITPLGTFATDDEDKFKLRHSLPSSQNYILKKRSFGIKNFLNFNFYNNIHVNSHDPIDKVLKSEIGNYIKDYFFFCFIRNPFEWIVRSFWWHIYLKNKRDINWINNLQTSEINKMFRNFLEEDSYNYFEKQRKIISNRNIEINVYKYENLEENIELIKKKLDLNEEKIPLKDIRFKKLNLNREIFIDANDEKMIVKNGEFFFQNYYEDAILPSKYKK